MILQTLLKNKYDKDGSDFEDKINKLGKKIPDVSGLVKKTDFNTKVTEIEDKISSITGLDTNSELTAVENKILDISGLVKNNTSELVISKRKLLIMIRTNTLLLQNLILWQQSLLMQD